MALRNENNTKKILSKEHRYKLSIAKIGTHRSAKTKQKISLSMKKRFKIFKHPTTGKPGWHKGMKMPPSWGQSVSKSLKKYYLLNPKAKIRFNKNCLVCKKEYETKDKESKFCCHSCYWVYRSFEYVGEKHPNWKGGFSKLIERIRKTKTYLKWRLFILNRDNNSCTQCGSKEELHVHHLTSLTFLVYKFNLNSLYEAKNCKELWDYNNGTTLCLKCHEKTDSYMKPICTPEVLLNNRQKYGIKK